MLKEVSPQIQTTKPDLTLVMFNGELQFLQSACANFQKEEFTMPIYGVPLLAVTATTILQTTNSHHYATRTMI